MEVDEAMAKLGFMKKWQVMCCFMVLFMIQPTPTFHKYNLMFFGYIPKHHCKIPHNSPIQQWIPKDKNGHFESCSMFVNSSVSNETVYCTDGWEYDDKECGMTIVNEWDLVCDRAQYTGYAQTLFFLGEIIAFNLAGFSDIFGRKPVFIVSLFLVSVTGLVNSFAGSFRVFIVEKFLIGVFNGATTIYPIYLNEITSSTNRELIVSGSYFHWGTNLLILVILAYFFRDWKYVNSICSLYGLLVLPIIILFLPETVYWLHANNRIKEAEEVLISAGKLNNVQFTRPIFVSNNKHISENKNYFEEKSFKERIKLKLDKILEKFHGSKRISKSHYSIKELYRNPYLRKHMLFSIVLFFKTHLVLGMTYMATSISSHRFLSAFLNVVGENFIVFASFPLIKRYSLRNLMMVFMFLTAALIFLCSAFLAFASEQVTNYSTVIIISIAKFCICIVVAITITYPSTIFPTNLRNRAAGICAILGRLGGVTSGFTIYMLTILPIGTYLIFAACALLGGLILIIFPDTSNLPLPETIEDIENIYKKDSAKTKLLSEMEVELDDEDTDE